MQSNKIEKLRKFGADQDLALFEEIADLTHAVEETKATIHKAMGGIKSFELDLVRGPKGDRGENGVAPTMDEILGEVLPRIPVPRDGVDGVSPAIEDIADEVLAQIELPKDGKDADHKLIVSDVLKKIKVPKDGSPDSPTEIRNKLESLRDEDRLQMGAIDGLNEKFAEIEEFQDKLLNDSKFRVRVFGGGAGGATQAAQNLYSIDGSLQGARNVTMNGNSLTFAGSTYSTVISAAGNITNIDGGTS